MLSLKKYCDDMKKLFLVGVLGFGFALTGCATSPEMQQATKPIGDITEIVEIDGQTKDQLYDASRIWIAKNFKSANNVIQHEDKSSGTLIGKGNIQFPCEGFIDCGAFGNDKVNFTIKIDTKDNKVRINLSDITRTSLTYVKGGLNTNIGRELPIMQIKQQQQVKTRLQSVVSQYKADILTQKTESKDW